MKILVAIDSFKESFGAKDGCDYIEEGLLKALPQCEIKKIPMADGGEGTCEVLAAAFQASQVEMKANNALKEEVNTHYYRSANGQVALIESAMICGLEMIPTQMRNPLHSTSYGLGQLIKHAAQSHVKKIIIGLGGTATNDGGVGMLHALGAKLYKNDQLLETVSVLDLEEITKIDIEEIKLLLNDIELIIASDVENPYIGEMGATLVFGKQKGASDADLEVLETQLVAFHKLIKETYNIQLNTIQGSGAAGGLGGAILLIGGAMQKGIDLVISETNLEQAIQEANLVISGEGSIDSQSANGKTISGIARMCKKHNKPFICIGGRVKEDIDALYDIGVDACFSITNESKTLAQALIDGPRCVKEVAYNVGRFIDVMLNKYRIK